MINPKNKLVAISNQNIENKKYLTIKEVCDVLKCHRNTADKLVKNCVDVKIEKNINGTATHKLYNIDEINEIKFSQEQQQIVKIEKKGDKIIKNNSMLEIANAFQKSLDNVDSQTIFDSAMALMNIALEKSNKLNQLLEEKNKQLEIELGKSKEYYFIKKVSIMNNKSQKDYKYSLLKRKSIELGLEIKTEQDNNYGKVNSYHINVWKEVYPNEKY